VIGKKQASDSVRALREPLRMGLTVMVLGAAALSLQAWLSNRHVWRTAGFVAATALTKAAIVLVLVLIVAGVLVALRPKRTVQQALLVIAVGNAILGMVTNRPLLALAGAISFALIVMARSLWWELSDTRASRLGRFVLLTATGMVVALFFLDRPKGTLIALFTLVFLIALGAGLWGLMLLVRNAPLPSSIGPLATVYEEYARAGISPFTLMHDKRYFWNHEGTAYLAYAARAGAAVVLGPGVGPAAALPSLYAEFRAESHRRGWRVGFYQVPQAMANEFGWAHGYKIGSEAIVDLDWLTLEGSVMAKLRHEVSRARRNGVTVRIVPNAAVTPRIRRAMRGLTEMRVQHAHFGEMGFSVGRSDDVPAVPTTVGLAYDAQDELVAYVTWLSLPAARGVSLDAMRRRADAPGGTMDLLLYTGLEHFKGRTSWASLGLAPAAGPSADSLSAFKAKFRPTWEPRYMVAERLIDWPVVAASTLLLHYPRLAQNLTGRVIAPVKWLRAA
jgi:phosphatidylglycerol lysyltransferase